MYLAQHITFQIKKRIILQDVHLQLQPGKFTALLGPNGAGKSTLLKVMSGRLKPQQGTVYLENKPLTAYTQQNLAMRRAVLPQQSIMQFPYSVLEVVMLGCIAHHKTKAEQTKLALKKLREVGFQYNVNRNYLNLSGGEQQRVQLARVLAQIDSPIQAEKYLLLDEPTASLDIAREQQLMQTARSLCKKKVGLLAVVHDLNLAIQYADELVLMKSGKVVKRGTVDEVIDSQLLEAVYEYPINIIRTTPTEKPMIIPASNRQYDTLLAAAI